MEKRLDRLARLAGASAVPVACVFGYAVAAHGRRVAGLILAALAPAPQVDDELRPVVGEGIPPCPRQMPDRVGTDNRPEPRLPAAQDWQPAEISHVHTAVPREDAHLAQGVEVPSRP
jgi:hypothetical protein